MSDDKKPGADAPHSGDASSPATPHTEVHHSQGVDRGYGYEDDPYGQSEPIVAAPVEPTKALVVPNPAPATQAGGSYNPPPPPRNPPKPPPKPDPEDVEEDGMLRMSFLEHLEELRTRIIRIIMGFGLAFLFCLIFANDLWRIIAAPATQALTNLGYNPPRLIAIEPMEQFSIIWVKVPMVLAVFLGSPVIVWQIWGFIAPGLYKRERRWAAPFIICTSGLFITGGLFAYFVVFRFGLEFLLGIGRDVGVSAFITISNYFDLFVNVMLGVGLVFELPVAIFFLTLIRVASPKFLLSHSRYAILGIMILAAVVTPTPDVFNMMLFAVPMVLLYFVGLFASYLLVLNREGKTFPWKYVYMGVAGLLALGAGTVWLMVAKFGFKLIQTWPFLTK